MELRQVRYFLALAEHLNFTRAADACGVTQPSLTQAIRKLEAEFGGALIVRERDKSHLTHLGRSVLPLLEAVSRSAEAACGIARDLAGGARAPLVVGIADTFDKTSLVGPLEALRESVAGLELTLVAGSDPALGRRLLEGELDAALFEALAAPDPRIRLHTLYHEAIVAAVHAMSPLAKRDTVAVEALATAPFVTLADAAPPPRLAEAAATAAPGWGPRHVVDRATEIPLLVAAGLGVGLVGAREPMPEGVVTRPIAGLDLARCMTLAVAAGRGPAPALQALVRLMRAQGYAEAA